MLNINRAAIIADLNSVSLILGVVAQHASDPDMDEDEFMNSAILAYNQLVVLIQRLEIAYEPIWENKP